MFGYVTVNWKELSKEEQERYRAIYCGICRCIRDQASQTARLTLSYDMAFLAALQMSLYEPEEQFGKSMCAAHPFRQSPWVENPSIRYAADMNVALAYFKALDDWNDEGKRTAKLLADSLSKFYPAIQSRYPRQCEAIEKGIAEISRLEQEGCDNPDLPATAFGNLMAELLVSAEDMWAVELRQMGFWLGRFVYLVDAMLDYDKDIKEGNYNPFAHKTKNEAEWEQLLLMTMARCTEHFEKLPLVQDKKILDNVLYSGVWVQYRTRMRKEEANGPV